MERLNLAPSKRDHDCARLRVIDRTIRAIDRQASDAKFTAYESLVAPKAMQRTAELEFMAYGAVRDILTRYRVETARELAR